MSDYCSRETGFDALCGIIAERKKKEEVGTEEINHAEEFIDDLKFIMDNQSKEDSVKVFPREKEYREVAVEVDMVNYPPHYTCHNTETIDIIDDYFINNYYLGQVFKYIARAGNKNDELEDLKKAKWYLNRYINIREEQLQ